MSSGELYACYSLSYNILTAVFRIFSQVVQSLLTCLDSPELPFLQWQECLSVLATRLPKDLRNDVSSHQRGRA